MFKNGTGLAKLMNRKGNTKTQYNNTKKKIQQISIGHTYTLEDIMQKKYLFKTFQNTISHNENSAKELSFNFFYDLSKGRENSHL